MFGSGFKFSHGPNLWYTSGAGPLRDIQHILWAGFSGIIL